MNVGSDNCGRFTFGCCAFGIDFGLLVHFLTEHNLTIGILAQNPSFIKSKISFSFPIIWL